MQYIHHSPVIFNQFAKKQFDVYVWELCVYICIHTHLSFKISLTNTLLYCVCNYSFSWVLLLSRPKLTLFSLHVHAFTTQRKWSASIKPLYLSIYVATGSSRVGSSDPFVFFPPPCLFTFSLLSTFLFLTLIHILIHLSLIFPTWQLVWWEYIPPWSREPSHEQRSRLLHRPSQSELSWWLLHLCQVSASNSIFLLLFLFNGVPGLLS